MPELVAFRVCQHVRCDLVDCQIRYWILSDSEIETLAQRFASNYTLDRDKIARRIYAEYNSCTGVKQFDHSIVKIYNRVVEIRLQTAKLRHRKAEMLRTHSNRIQPQERERAYKMYG